MISKVCGFIVAMSIMGLICSVIWLLFTLLMKKNKMKAMVFIIIFFSCIIVFTLMGTASAYTSGELVAQNRTESLNKGIKIDDTTQTITNSEKRDKSITQKSVKKQDKKKVSRKKEEPETETEQKSVIEKKNNNTKKVTSTESENKSTENKTISESDYKSSCTEMWYDDIFFSKKDLDKKLVKLDLFVEEDRFYTIGTIEASSSLYDILKEYDLQRSFFYCGVNRSNEKKEYAGAGQLSLYIPNSYTDTIKTGDHLIVYGQIIEYSTNTWDGYNKCSVVPKYITNNGQ